MPSDFFKPDGISGKLNTSQKCPLNPEVEFHIHLFQLMTLYTMARSNKIRHN